MANRTANVPEERERDDRKCRRPRLVTLCCVRPSRNSQRTVSPAWMWTVRGPKSMLRMVTLRLAAAAGAAAAAASRTRAAASGRMPRVRLALLCGSLLLAGCGGAAPAPRTTAAPGGAAALRYGVVGDSYSNGEGVGLERSWPAQLARRLGVAVVANPSVTGWTTRQALDEELPVLERAGPQVATVQLGVNDWVQGVTAATFRAQLGEVLDRVVAAVGGPRRVVAVTIPDFSVTRTGGAYTGGRDATAGLRAFNAIIAAECRTRGIAVADVFVLSRAMADPALTAPDGLHPSERELALWTDRIEPVARRAWAGLPGAP